MSDKPALWVGRVTPVNMTELAQFYWTTDLPVAEIAAAYGHGAHFSSVNKSAGSAYLRKSRKEMAFCDRCIKPIYVHSRTEASSAIEAFDRRGGMICKECRSDDQREHLQQFFAKQDASAERLRELANMPYGEYLKTPEWRATRQAALKRARYACQTCASGGELHVHHRTYIRRGREWSSDLIVLCARCHELFHQNARLAEGGRSPTAASVKESAVQVSRAAA